MKRTIFILLVSLLVLGNLAARPSSLAIGAQVGFINTGVVVDLGLGSTYLNAGIGYPLGITYLAYAGGEELIVPASTVSADITYAFALSDSFSLKVGVGGTGMTDFHSGFLGVLGPVLKSEYWVPNKHFGLNVTLHIPVVMAGGFEDMDDVFAGYSAMLPVLGLFTSTIGVLFSF